MDAVFFAAGALCGLLAGLWLSSQRPVDRSSSLAELGKSLEPDQSIMLVVTKYTSKTEEHRSEPITNPYWLNN